MPLIANYHLANTEKNLMSPGNLTSFITPPRSNVDFPSEAATPEPTTQPRTGGKTTIEPCSTSSIPESGKRKTTAELAARSMLTNTSADNQSETHSGQLHATTTASPTHSVAFTEKDILAMYQNKKREIQKEAIELATKRVQDYPVIASAIKVIPFMSIPRIVTKLLNDQLQDDLLVLFTREIAAFVAEQNQESAPQSFIQHLISHKEKLTEDGIQIMEKRVQSSSSYVFKRIYTTVDGAALARMESMKDENIKEVAAIFSKYCDPALAKILGLPQ